MVAFLQGRTQFTRIEDRISTRKYLSGGIPQGTKLGPLLFAIMVNDLVSSWAPRAKFVDDLTVFEVVPRNSPSLLNFIVNEIDQSHMQLLITCALTRLSVKSFLLTSLDTTVGIANLP